MDCQQVAERLPWIVNGTLGGNERDEVRRHLTTCPACQRELDETRAAARMFGQHVSPADLIDYAFDPGTSGVDRQVIARHLERCPACRDELALVRESRRLDPAQTATTQGPRVVDFTARRLPVTWWQYAALAAGLVVLTGVNVWLWAERRATPATDSRVAALESENQRLERAAGRLTDERAEAAREVARLQGEVARLNAPQINAPVLELFPSNMTKRGTRPDVTEIDVSTDAASLTLILNSQNVSASSTASVEIVDAKDEKVWDAQGLVRHKTGDYTITIPSRFLPPGAYTLRVFGERGGRRALTDTYRIRVK